jgi:hypothetical protein
MELSSNSIDILATRLVSEDERRARSSNFGGSAIVGILETRETKVATNSICDVD